MARNRSREVYDHYATLIDTGKMKQGEQLPAVHEIATIWQVSYATATKAVSALRDAYLVKTSSAGTFVYLPAPHRLYRQLSDVLNQLDAVGQDIRVQEFGGMACLEGKDSGVCKDWSTQQWVVPTPR